MDQKSVLITGCSSGIGLHLAESLHQRGYQVFASARKQSDVDDLIQRGLNALLLDINDSTSIQQAVEKTLEQTNGKLFALINNAGFGQQGAVEDLTREALRRQFETNVFGLIELTNKIIPVMQKQKFGRIIQISSVLGFVAIPFSGAYVSSKFALEGISDTLRLELKDTNILVSLIEPGPITSQFRQNSANYYKKHLDVSNSRFLKQYNKVENKVKQEKINMPFTLGPEAVCKKVIHALESSRPKARYFVTLPTYLLAYLKRILPIKALDYILLKSSKISDK